MAHRQSDICPKPTARMRRCLILVRKLRSSTAASVQMVARPASQQGLLASIGLGRRCEAMESSPFSTLV
ncbi:hypothetical protein COCC4DRAFT_129915 [Bipolaris maydis ATCC 48331]|uniref:Uncharacterized protein n=2 Tax=Cochliobolus heterostrophus TaxID=5016 RepID=M2U231_COCH5|nr:uncharacterized protein COCC4DRAFT_129915 [Bipolaris maydis ATCC 48331]EMD92619.1 hypothetical protein COCHEDRAFT_1155577 [Bipolaris maydis C5]ENI08315.1 hypothetical protein COCC4DRAFT_129915 [Bipolaris maydis ATCC 48331]